MTPTEEIDLKMAEPDPGSVVKISVAYPGSPVTYTYVALEVKGQWYLTGSANHGTWTALIDYFKGKDATVLSLAVATSWETL